MNKRIKKFTIFAIRYIYSLFGYGVLMVRFIPSNKCNLSCKYCWQHTQNSLDMTKEDFDIYLAKAHSLHVGMMDFMGGEPLLWPHIYYAIQAASTKNILIHITTNGTLLTKENLDKLGKAGLDYLNISVDNLQADDVSAKNKLSDTEFIQNILDFKKQYKTKVRFNAVIYKDNFQAIKELLEVTHKYKLPLSLGFITPLEENSENDNGIYFSKNDEELLKEIVDYLIQKKREKYKLIDPVSYYQSIFKFLNKELFWQCNYPSRFGWINVLANGKIRSCTKHMDELEFKFLDLNFRNIKELRVVLREKVIQCNRFCYSNCAYDSWYFKKHRLEFIRNL